MGVGQLDAVTVLYMAFNFFSAIGIIFANKFLMKSYDFKYASFTTSCHFLATMAGLLICRLAGVYKPKVLSHAQVFPISLAFCIPISSKVSSPWCLVLYVSVSFIYFFDSRLYVIKH